MGVETNCTLSKQEAQKLLDVLCLNLGFCISPEDYKQIASDPPPSVSGFVEAVFAAEGLNPDTADQSLLRQVRDVVAERFRSAGEDG